MAEWKRETGQEEQTCLAHLKETTLFFKPGESMGRTKPLCVSSEQEAAGLDGTAFGVLLRHQYRAAAPTGRVSKVFPFFYSWGKSAERARLRLPFLSATHQGIFILMWSEKVKSIISAPEVPGWTISQLVCSEFQLWVCCEKKTICGPCEYWGHQRLLTEMVLHRSLQLGRICKYLRFWYTYLMQFVCNENTELFA